MATVSFSNVSKTYPDGTRAVIDLDLAIEDGEFMVLVGPSGSGKTTALRMLAGLEEITEGTVEIGGRVVNDVSPRDRDIAMVFQNYALYPHMNVADNIGFGLRLRKQRKTDIAAKVQLASRMLGLDRVLEKKPRELSGGQRQRVAMGRAIVRQPQVFLMDEPLSNLDAQLRVQMRAEIRRLQRELGVTTLYVTHDQVEAMTLGDRVAVFREGVLQQVDDPTHLYRRPANVFVARFIGSPSMNLLQAVVHTEPDGTSALQLGDERLELDGPQLRSRLQPFGGRSILLGVRPESLRLDGEPSASLTAHVELVEVLGSESLVHASLNALATPTEHLGTEQIDGAMVIARTEALRAPSTGEHIRIGLDPDALHFFDPETEAAV